MIYNAKNKFANYSIIFMTTSAMPDLLCSSGEGDQTPFLNTIHVFVLWLGKIKGEIRKNWGENKKTIICPYFLLLYRKQRLLFKCIFID